MTNDQVEVSIKRSSSADGVFEIKFKTRNPIKGKFIKTSDYDELSRKNLWRIVHESHFEAYAQSQDESLARIFNGSDFTKLQPLS